MTTTTTIRDTREYTVSLRDEGGATETMTTAIPAGTEADQDEAAMAWAIQAARDWAAGGEWGADGALVSVGLTLEDADSEWDEECVEVAIEPDHATLIARAVPSGAECCGTDPDDHEWTASVDVEGGLRENPGVWSTGGTSLVIRTHCAHCGLRRREQLTGAQRNPGEHDTVSYSWA